MNTKHLALFQEVAKTGNVTQVATRMHISQPAVSMQLHRLEDELGVPLFTMIGRNIALTDAGKALLEYSESILSLEGQLYRVMNEFQAGKQGRIVVGASLGVGTYMLPDVIQSFWKMHPGIAIDLCICGEDEVEKRVRAGQLDIGFTLRSPEEHFSLRVTQFVHDELVGVKAPEVDHVGKLWISKELAALDVTVGEVGVRTTTAPMEATAAGVRTPLVAELEIATLESIELVKRYVWQGLGYGVVLKSAVRCEMESGKLQPWSGYPTRPIAINIITRPAERLAQSVLIFLHHVRDVSSVRRSRN